MAKFKHLHKVLKEGYGIIHGLDRWKLPIMLLNALLNAALPFIAIILSAEIINRLAAGDAFHDTLIFAIISLVIIFILTIFNDTIAMTNEIRLNKCHRLYEFKKSEAMMDMEFSELENPKLSALRSRLELHERQGFGLWSLFYDTETFFRGFLTAALSLLLLLPTLLVTDVIPVLWFIAFVCVSIIFSVLAALYKKYVDGKLNAALKDDSTRSVEWLQSREIFLTNPIKYSDGKDIRIFGFQGAIRECLKKSLHFLISIRQKTDATLSSLADGLGGAIMALIMGSSFIFVAVFATGGGMPLGTVILTASLTYRLVQAIMQQITAFGRICAITESLQLYVEFTSPKSVQSTGATRFAETEDCGHIIEFKNVSFKYPGNETYALKNFTFKFEPGKRLAVVGMNGSGKTTMIKLLCRLYDPTEGEILLNGVNIQEYDVTEYRRIFSVVFQDFMLFSFTLGEVLAASATYDESRAEDCLIKVGLGERYSEMSDGLKTYLYKDYDDGVELSGGEAQKAALARALYKNAPFIVLDEPTAALDPISEFEIYSKFNEIVEDKTAIFISHRLSSCRFCDDIAVFHEGELIQRGNHDTLVSDENGKYFEMWNAQAQYYS